MANGGAPRELLAGESDLVDRFARAGQEQIFRFRERLSTEEKALLLADARTIDLDLVARLAADLISGKPRALELGAIDAIDQTAPDRAEALEAGRALFAEGEVAFFTVAGGQGTRLGFDGPKGCFSIVPGKTLFAWHAEKVLAASRRYGRDVPWVVMVSRANAEATRLYFEENGWFGLQGRVRLVEQRMLPAVDEDGRILLRTPFRIALSPNGHGGALEALHRGAGEWLRDRGIRLVSYFQVDNPLLDAADLRFVGHHAVRNVEMSAKVVLKNDPLEKAGVVAMVNGRPGVVEYSELPDELARETGPDGRLKYAFANIAAHVLSLDFVERVHAEGLPHHTAVKTVPTVDAAGRPTQVTGRKFETFIFDAIPLARGFNVFLTKRWAEFAPLKSAEGDNSSTTVRAALADRVRRWFAECGEAGPEKDEAAFEMSPIVAYDLDTFREHLRAGGSAP